jgi:hypothetical protein
MCANDGLADAGGEAGGERMGAAPRAAEALERGLGQRSRKNFHRFFEEGS